MDLFKFRVFINDTESCVQTRAWRTMEPLTVLTVLPLLVIGVTLATPAPGTVHLVGGLPPVQSGLPRDQAGHTEQGCITHLVIAGRKSIPSFSRSLQTSTTSRSV